MTDFNLVLSQVRQRLEILYQIVDELEAQGGGGGQGGTDNYNELSNKPQINGHTLTGNKTGSSLGLASTSDLEAYLTFSEAAATYQTLAGMSSYLTSSDAASTYQTQAGMSSYYTKTETDSEITSEITGAINDLDVSAVGGSTKYLTTISEANGLIDATAATPDTVPTTSSTKLITSGGVKTYVDDAKAAANAYTDTEVSGLMDNTIGDGTSITATSGIDFDNFTTPGRWNFTTNAATNAANKPASISGVLQVEYQYSANRLRQTYYQNGSEEQSKFYYVRSYIYGAPGDGGDYWTPWTIIGTFGVTGRYVNPSTTDPVSVKSFTVGKYYCGDGQISSKFTDLPADWTNTSSIIIEVSSTLGASRRMIKIYAHNEPGKFWQCGETTGGWTAWYRFDGEQVQAPAANTLSLGDEMRTAVEPDEDEPQDER